MHKILLCLVYSLATNVCREVICKQIRVEIEYSNSKYKGFYDHNKERNRYENRNNRKIFFKRRGRTFVIREIVYGKYLKRKKKYLKSLKNRVILKGKYHPKYNLTLAVDTLANKANKKACEQWQVDWTITKGEDKGKKIEVTCADNFRKGITLGCLLFIYYQLEIFFGNP